MLGASSSGRTVEHVIRQLRCQIQQLQSSKPTLGTSQLSPEDIDVIEPPMVTQPILCSINRGRRNCEGVRKSP
ncbi:hypothetical protein GIB67_006896, partial [Kingdonia uniflora]